MLRPGIAAAGLALVMLVACAKVEPPPGAPPDLSPPHLVSATPESLAILPGYTGDVTFRYNEVIAEGSSPSQGTGTGDLERLVILSPTTRPPEVRWRRDHITVRPREGWLPNRVYRVQLLPGVMDLRSNRETSGGTIVTFTTGAARPTLRLTGSVQDWVSGRAATGALVEAVHTADSLVYRAVTDSSGGFDLGPIPDGQYLVFASIDQNHNMTRDPREAFDSVRIAAGRTDAGTLWTFPHDTVGPRIQTITMLDSASATVALSQPLDPSQRLAASAVSVRLLPDSTPVQVTSLLPPTVDDSAFGRRAVDSTARRAADTAAVRRGADTAATRRAADSAGARRPADTLAARKPADTLAARRPVAAPARKPVDSTAARKAVDTTSRAAPNKPARPPLADRLVLRVAGRWTPGARYVITIHGLRNVNGVAADATAGLAIPAAPPPPPAHPADSTGAAPPPATPADTGARRSKPQ